MLTIHTKSLRGSIPIHSSFFLTYFICVPLPPKQRVRRNGERIAMYKKIETEQEQRLEMAAAAAAAANC